MKLAIYAVEPLSGVPDVIESRDSLVLRPPVFAARRAHPLQGMRSEVRGTHAQIDGRQPA